MTKLLEGKKILIMGVANKWSIAWGIAQSCINAGAELIFTYLDDKNEKNIRKLTENIPSVSLYPCNVTIDEDIENLFKSIKEDHGVLHGLVHSIAFAKTDELEGDFYDTSRDGYLLAQDISSYSLTAVSRGAMPLMTEGGSIITLTYMGSERVVPNYNVMGVAKAALEASVRYLASDLGPKNIRVNSISAGPVKTVSARGIKDFSLMYNSFEEKAPLRRTITPEDVGDTAIFLLSNLSRAITGENIHVDGGYHIVGF